MPSAKSSCLAVIVFLTLGRLGPVSAAEANAEAAVNLLEARCFKCHSHAAGKNKGGLVMDAAEALLKGGDTGAAIDPARPPASLLIEHVLSADPEKQMPPKGDRLTATEVTSLTDWIKAGAPWPASRQAKATASRYLPGTIGTQERSWWAYQPITRPTPPTGPASHPLDRFIDERLTQAKLTAAPEATRATLIRRATFDITGLPPTPEATAAFVADTDPQAYAKLVDRLLASPGYGERQARLWLDLVRYADSDGYRIDDFRPTAWHYRDYVIAAFNSNKPFDRFTQEQLAADELFPTDDQARAALGYLRHWIYEYNARDVRGQWDIILNDLTDTTADVFLGAGMQCARCHDHKFDPILQRDYFALRSFFNNFLPVDTASQPAAGTAKTWEAKTAKLRADIAALEAPHRRAAEKDAVGKFPDDIQAMLRKPVADRNALEHQLAELAYRQVYYEYDRLDRRIKGEELVRLAELKKALAAFDAEKPVEVPMLMVAADTGRPAMDAVIPKKGTVVAPAFLTVLSGAYPAPAAEIKPITGSSGRRAALARWLTDSRNPLTARVTVNRIWQQYFHRGLSPYASDFGRLGEAPSHPALLDYLAASFIDSGWDLKAVHRLILTSQAYRRSALHPDPTDGQRVDPQGTLLWRAQPQRVDAEELRDAIFSATGELKGTHRSGPSAQPTDPVRSIFVRSMRNNRDPLLDAFDAPLWFASTASRDVTTTPVQSLLLLNSPFMLKRGEALAQRLFKEAPTSAEARVQRLYQLLYQRDPRPSELTRALGFLATQQESKATPRLASNAFLPEKVPFRDGQGARLELDHHLPFMAKGTDKLDLAAGFTIEGIVVPRSVSETGQLRVIATKGGKSSWTLGITGQQSRRAPMVLTLQCYGNLRDGTFGEAVHFTGLRIQLNKPYFVAAAVRFATKDQPGEVTFSLKDLGNDDEPLLIEKVSSKLVALPDNTGALSLGGRVGARTDGFHGVIDDLRLSTGLVPTGKLLFTSEDPSAETLGFWRFENKSGIFNDSSAGQHTLTQPSFGTDAQLPESDQGARRALAALCHALLNSTEFLYLE